MLLALVAAFALYAPAHLARGICSGTGQFRDYAIVMGSDWVVRIALCLLLAAVGIEPPALTDSPLPSLRCSGWSSSCAVARCGRRLARRRPGTR